MNKSLHSGMQHRPPHTAVSRRLRLGIIHIGYIYSPGIHLHKAKINPTELLSSLQQTPSHTSAERDGLFPGSGVLPSTLTNTLMWDTESIRHTWSTTAWSHLENGCLSQSKFRTGFTQTKLHVDHLLFTGRFHVSCWQKGPFKSPKFNVTAIRGLFRVASFFAFMLSWAAKEAATVPQAHDANAFLRFRSNHGSSTDTLGKN